VRESQPYGFGVDAVTLWLMTPGAPDVPLTLEGFLARPQWHQLASCRGETRTFFSGAVDTIERARAICRDCPVRQECHEKAMSDPALSGVWAGLTGRERRELRRRRAA
jgi:WhiB family transcriptional regulator, redox-sensing transcriptional regulator